MHEPLTLSYPLPYMHHRFLSLPLFLTNVNLPVYLIHILCKNEITSVSIVSETKNECDFSQIRSRI